VNPRLGPLESTFEDLCALAGPAIVKDTTGPVVIPEPPTVEELQQLFCAWQKQERAAWRARRRFEAVDGRYTRLTGECPPVR
jgi:hypothetical protein